MRANKNSREVCPLNISAMKEFKSKQWDMIILKRKMADGEMTYIERRKRLKFLPT